MTLTDKQVFTAALARLDELGWTTGSNGADSSGGPMCAAAAIAWAVTGDGDDMYAATSSGTDHDYYNQAAAPFVKKWMKHTSPNSVLPYAYNDDPGRTFEEIRARFLELIEGSE